MMDSIKIATRLIRNGSVEILKIKRDTNDNWINGEGFAIKYNHSKAIQGITYDVNQVKFAYGNDYESIVSMTLENTYVVSLYDFIRKCNFSFCNIENNLRYETKYTDSENIDRILPLEKTNGFYFGIDIGKFTEKESGVCSIETVRDGDYLVIMDNHRPFSKSPEEFFNSNFEIIDDDKLYIPRLDFSLYNCSYEQYRTIVDTLFSTIRTFDFHAPNQSKDTFYKARARYIRERETNGKTLGGFDK